ncbi:hypothetical protein NQ317_003173 [Molorchus minor]|uniref:Uncharacterized protein n=1 Tax=Molorchus minor TaxID=1323400 RepID=A0ABQ9JCH7_9CUCU|nr:hypothetical protein NQ317_003173 [Molorchus minor]
MHTFWDICRPVGYADGAAYIPKGVHSFFLSKRMNIPSNIPLVYSFFLKEGIKIYTSVVKMFETHTPGFCYRRNGEQRNVQEVPVNPSIDFQEVHYLVFTDGEVDIEKIICLHLLSAHRAETLTPSRKKNKYVCKEHSPTERLVDRSKKGFNNYEKLSQLLPLYTIELHESRGVKESKQLINDGRLAARILVNEKIRELLNTVVSGLEHSNRSKLKRLACLAKDTSSLRKIVTKKSVSDFLETLYGHSLINSCESYVLTPPFRIKTRDLDIRTLSGNIENLIRHVRQNVLQPPAENVWKSQIKTENRPERHPQASPNTIIPPIGKTQSQFSKIPSKFENMHGNRETLRRPSEEEEEKLTTRKGPINFITRNIEAAAKVRRIQYDPEAEYSAWSKRPGNDSNRSRKGSGFNRGNQNFLPVIDSAHEEEDEENKVIRSDVVTPRESLFSDVSAKRRSAESRDEKLHIKHTNCPACMAKRRTPLPSPKTPRVKKSNVLPISDHALKTNLHNRITMMINKEIHKLESYDRKYSADSESSRRFTVKRKSVEQNPLDNVNLDPLDLAKIEQEIKERETKKKLEKFMNE